MLLMSIAALVEILTKSLHAVLRGTQDTGPVGVSLVIQRVGTALVAVPLLVLGAGLLEICAIYLGGALAGGLWVLVLMLRRGQLQRPTLQVGAAWALLVLSIPIGLNEIFGVVMSRVDVGILVLLEDERAAGVYGAAYRLFESTLFLSWGLGAAALPAFAVLDRTTTPTIGEALELALKVSAATLLPIGAALTVFAPIITSTIYGDAYSGSVDALRWLGFAAATYGFFMLPSFLLIAEGRARALAWITGGAILANVVANLALIPRYSVTGAAAAMAITQLLLSAAMIVAAVGRPSARSAGRVIGGPLLGAAAMAVIGAWLGQTVLALIVALAAYAIVLLAVERWWHPQDLQLARTLVGRQLRRAP